MAAPLVDIRGLPKHRVLLALWDATKTYGMGALHSSGFDAERAKKTVETNKSLYFDWIAGRPIKCDLSGDSFDPQDYDTVAGTGAAKRAIDILRAEIDGTPLPTETPSNGLGSAQVDIVDLMVKAMTSLPSSAAKNEATCINDHPKLCKEPEKYKFCKVWLIPEFAKTVKTPNPDGWYMFLGPLDSENNGTTRLVSSMSSQIIVIENTAKIIKHVVYD